MFSQGLIAVYERYRVKAAERSLCPKRALVLGCLLVGFGLGLLSTS